MESILSNCNYRFHEMFVFVLVTIISMVDLGCVFSFGALFVSVSEAFQADRATTATVQSLLIGVYLSTGVLNGVLITRLGLPLSIFIASFLAPAGFCASYFANNIYFLYISIGIVSALGLSLVYVSSIVIVGSIFTGKQRLLCLSVLHTANAAYALINPYILTWLAGLFGLRGAFLINGGLSLNTFPLFLICWFNRHNNVRNRDKPISKRITDSLLKRHVDSDDGEGLQIEKKPIVEKLELHSNSSDPSMFLILKNILTKQYICLLLGTCLCLVTINGYLGLILDIALWKGLTHSEGLMSFLFFSIFGVISRLIPGLLKLRRGINSFLYPMISTFFGCVGQALVYFAKNHIVFLTGSALTGFAYGGVVSSSINVVVKIMPSEQVAVACGLLTTAEGILSVAVAPVFGKVRDTSGSYYSVITAIWLTQALAACVFTLALVLRRKDRRNQKRPYSLEVQ